MPTNEQLSKQQTTETQDVNWQRRERLNELIGVLPQEARDEVKVMFEEETQRAADGETVLYQVRVALKLFFDWHTSFRNKHSSEYDAALKEIEIATVYIGKYLLHYGQKKSVLASPRANA